MTEMVHKIADSLLNMAVPVESLTHLPGNPRKGDVDAIAMAYETFGQLNNIICMKDGDDTIVLSGNHQLMAARDVLGWTHIAAVVHESLTHEEAMAFAALENHWGDVGSIDSKLQYDMLLEAGEVAIDVFDAVGWDDFEMAAMENAAIVSADIAANAATSGSNSGWAAPEIIAPLVDPDPPRERGKDETAEEVATEFNPAVDTNTIVNQGSAATSKVGSRHAVIQYTLVFDEPEQQATWYSFIRYLKYDSGNDTEGQTTAAMICDFIQEHTEVS